jgi:hypothetical protein
MKYLIAVTLMLCLAVAANAQVQHLKFKNDGAFANATGSTDPNTTFQLSVSSTTSGASTNTTLFFESISVTPDGTSETFTLVIGPIPDSDFTGRNTSNLSLNLDTSTLDPTQTFSITCTIDLATFIQTCTEPASAGIIALTFQENGVDRTQILTLQQVTTVGPVTTRLNQKSDNGSANVQGTIFGSAVTSATATIGVNHSSTLEMISTM